MDDLFEELYELLDLYFQTQVRTTKGFINAYGNCSDVEQQLDAVIFKEELKKKIVAISQHIHLL